MLLRTVQTVAMAVALSVAILASAHYANAYSDAREARLQAIREEAKSATRDVYRFHCGKLIQSGEVPGSLLTVCVPIFSPDLIQETDNNG